MQRNAAQCNESIDESDSLVHQIPRDEDYATGAIISTTKYLLGDGISRNPFTSPLHKFWPELVFMTLLHDYGRRKLTNQGDALNAFSGIMHAYKASLDEDFIFGLPLSYIDWALMWDVQRYGGATRPNFPTWSWASWDGLLQPYLIRRAYPALNVELKIWCIWQGQVRMILYTQDDSKRRMRALREAQAEADRTGTMPDQPPMYKPNSISSTEPCPAIFGQYLGEDIDRLLCIDTLTIHFGLDLSGPRKQTKHMLAGVCFQYDMALAEACVTCSLLRDSTLFHIYTDYPEIQHMYLLMGKNKELDDLTDLFFIAVEPCNELYKKIGVMMRSMEPWNC